MFGCGLRAHFDTRGLGLDTQLKKKKTSAQAEERQSVLEILDERIDELRYLHATQVAHFAEWCKWDGIMAQDKLWRTAIYQHDDTLFQWTIKAIEDQCPSPQVLKCWRKIENAACPICRAAGCSLKHILVGCSSALHQNRYTWRHDSILLNIYRAVRVAVNRGRARLKQGIAEKPHQTTFVPSGLLSPVGSANSSQAACVIKSKKVHTVSSPQKTLFEQSDDWVVQFDLEMPEDGQMKSQPFPTHIAAVGKRPDGLMYSDKLKNWSTLNSLHRGKRT